MAVDRSAKRRQDDQLRLLFDDLDDWSAGDALFVGPVALYGAFAIHFSLAFWAIYIRRNLRLTLS